MKALGGYLTWRKEDCASIVNIKANYKAGDWKWFFTFPAGTLEERSSYEIQMRYLEHPKINLLENEEPKNKY